MKIKNINNVFILTGYALGGSATVVADAAVSRQPVGLGGELRPNYLNAILRHQKTTRMSFFGVVAVVAIFTTMLTACDNGSTGGGGGKDPTPQGPTQPAQDHTGTITAFSKTINVKGAASIPVADFNSAKAKMQSAMTAVDDPKDPDRQKFINMLNRAGFAIIIGAGSAAPAADTNKSMTVGVDYLNNKNYMIVGSAIMTIVCSNNAFAKAAAKEAVQLAKAPVDLKAFAKNAAAAVTAKIAAKVSTTQRLAWEKAQRAAPLAGANIA